MKAILISETRVGPLALGAAIPKRMNAPWSIEDGGQEATVRFAGQEVLKATTWARSNLARCFYVSCRGCTTDDGIVIGSTRRAEIEARWPGGLVNHPDWPERVWRKDRRGTVYVFADGVLEEVWMYHPQQRVLIWLEQPGEAAEYLEGKAYSFGEATAENAGKSLISSNVGTRLIELFAPEGDSAVAIQQKHVDKVGYRPVEVWMPSGKPREATVRLSVGGTARVRIHAPPRPGKRVLLRLEPETPSSEAVAQIVESIPVGHSPLLGTLEEREREAWTANFTQFLVDEPGHPPPGWYDMATIDASGAGEVRASGLPTGRYLVRVYGPRGRRLDAGVIDVTESGLATLEATVPESILVDGPDFDRR
ncbi:MAG: hypothetical protein HY901_07215 [Deltaproteobacteria bacterium]|nr:hypothetical protein [Deltaproteobacteria bacterium]